jgi:hypothetical protein
MSDTATLLQAVKSAEQIASTQAALDQFNQAAATSVSLLIHMTQAATEAAAALERVIAAEKRLPKSVRRML